MKMKQSNIILILAMSTLATALSAGCSFEPQQVSQLDSNIKKFTKKIAVVDWQVQIREFTPYDMAIDSSGHIYVTGVLHQDAFNSSYYTVKVDGNGTRLWQAQYAGTSSGLNMAEAIAVDDENNVYVTGASRIGDLYDFATVKYSPDGQELWVARYDGQAQGEDWAYDVQLDHDGNVYVMGESSNGTDVDVVTVKYDEQGQQVWVARYDTGEDDVVLGFGQTLAVDSALNVYTVGFSALLKYDVSGNQLYAIEQQCNAIALDEHENVVLTSPRGTQLFDPDGQVVWQNDQGGTHLALVDGKGIWITTALVEDPYDWHMQTSRLSFDGTLEWRSVYDSGLADSPAGIAVDQAGNAYVTGRSDSKKGLMGRVTPDMLTVKYNEQGEQIWTQRQKDGYGQALVSDGQGSIYVTGFEGTIEKVSEEEKPCGWWNMWCRFD